MARHIKLLALITAVIFLPGCATVTTGRHQKVPIDSNPRGADVTISSGYQGTTPCSFDLLRNKDHIIKITKSGYKTAQITLRKTLCGSTCGNVILGGIIGLGVDAMSGAMFKLIPEKVFVDLVPGDEKDIISSAAPRYEQKDYRKSGPALTTKDETPVIAQSGVPVVAEQRKIANADEYYCFIREEIITALCDLSKQEKGAAYLMLTITSDGQLKNIEIEDARSTVSAELRQLIIQTVSKLAPFPDFPGDITKEKISIAIPVTFNEP